MTPSAAQDPGWGFTKATFILIFVPGGFRQLARKNGPNTNGLVLLRQIFLSFVSAGVLISVIAWLFVRGQGAHAPALWIAVTVVVGGASFVAVRRFEPGLNCANGRALGASYQTRLFIRMAGGEVALIAGFVCTLASGIWWTYFVGAICAIPAFWRAAPSVAKPRPRQGTPRASGVRSNRHCRRVCTPPNLRVTSPRGCISNSECYIAMHSDIS